MRRKIEKRHIKLDELGNIYQVNVEALVDDEQGNITETTVDTQGVCRSCLRPLENPNQIRSCSVCSLPCCDLCSVACAVCSRRLDRHCVRGFAEKGIPVCEACLSLLDERLRHHDRLLEEKVGFERRLAVVREEIRLLQQGVLYPYPGADLLQQLAEVRLMKKLTKLERALIDYERRGK